MNGFHKGLFFLIWIDALETEKEAETSTKNIYMKYLYNNDKNSAFSTVILNVIALGTHSVSQVACV